MIVRIIQALIVNEIVIKRSCQYMTMPHAGYDQY